MRRFPVISNCPRSEESYTPFSVDTRMTVLHVSRSPLHAHLILTEGQGAHLRVFKHESVLLSTFETDRSRDPRRIHTIPVSDDADDNLFPSKLEGPSHSGLPSAKQTPGGGRYGYPICWSKRGYEWYPYLPAVVNSRHPIFRGMRFPPDIIHDGSGYRLKDDEMSTWQNVEYVMDVVAKLLGSRQLVSLDHRIPHPPSRYGYTRVHTQERFARKSAIKSLNAFHRLLAYCSYCMSGVVWRESVAESRGFYAGYSDADLYKGLDEAESNLHILAKNLLSSLRDIANSRNFTGIVVNYAEDYDYRAVEHMISCGVPVYVSWPSPNSNAYARVYQRQVIKDFRPTPEQFAAWESRIPHPEAPLVPTLNTPTTHCGFLPTTEPLETYAHPLDYVKLRLQNIPAELDGSPNKQAMVDRLRSASRLVRLGSAKYFQFEAVTIIDADTGLEKTRWVREELTRHYARIGFECAYDNHLWYGPLFPSQIPSF